MNKEKHISVIIPNYNGSATIGLCLEAALASRYENYEVVVVDDCSTDNSTEIIRQFPCKLIRLNTRSGASRARNAGARNCAGEHLFFIDADCLLHENALALANEALNGAGRAVLGGTYTEIPYDDGFFSAFQSIFIHYSETKGKEPDYIASHAMIIPARDFQAAGGFPETFLPIIEDVEFSHRLRRAGYKLAMAPGILVSHVFNFTLAKSLKNAFRKSFYWTVYSLRNRDVFKDSGAASVELKANVASFFLSAAAMLLFLYTKNPGFIALFLFLLFLNAFFNRRLLRAYYEAKGLSYSFLAALYYLFVYPVPVGAGACGGMFRYIWRERIRRKG